MDYGKLLESVKSASKSDLEEISFELDNEQYHKIKKLGLPKENETEIIKMFKDCAFYSMLLINALK